MQGNLCLFLLGHSLKRQLHVLNQLSNNLVSDVQDCRTSDKEHMYTVVTSPPVLNDYLYSTTSKLDTVLSSSSETLQKIHFLA